MSARSRKSRNQPALNAVSRRDRAIAIGGSFGIVLISAVLIWAMRPGNVRPGTGGIIYRQPRASWLVLLFIAGVSLCWWFAKRSDSKFRNTSRAAALMIAGVTLTAVAVVVFWDVKWDGIVRTYTPPPTFPTAPIPTSTTTAPGATTTTASSTGPGATTTTLLGPTTTADTSASTTTATSTPTPTVAPTTTGG